ncbi:uncharacterized protein LOC112043745 isoform X1 [Bicyclus anynana]|uniref:Uncharacterized protein LOC112043745 isoform X1 n=1 Tax=Bicyclus anynana TaxID=110368 RepID=A0ABM3LV42_BICAN|nr:uncharacterized protein LOC112043745 isoform X1 [Bicyclus anynana]
MGRVNMSILKHGNIDRVMMTIMSKSKSDPIDFDNVFPHPVVADPVVVNPVVVDPVVVDPFAADPINSDLQLTFLYIPLFFLILLAVLVMIYIYRRSFAGQKTRNSQQRRTFVAPRQRPSVSQTEPTIYVSPANLPPPPKYEAMAPPSYEEVVGIHYPNYQPVQPITQPITTALAQSSNSADNVTVTDTENNVTNTVTQNNASCSVPSNVAPAVVTIANERTVPTASS